MPICQILPHYYTNVNMLKNWGGTKVGKTSSMEFAFVGVGRFETQSWGASNRTVVKNTKSKTKKDHQVFGGLCDFVLCAVD